MDNQNSLLPIAVSACLLGQPVRYDGKHRYDQTLVSRLRSHFTLLGICPEVAIGLGVPRATIALYKNQQTINLLATHNPEQDYTQAMINFSHRYLRQNVFYGLVLKDRSPSCGVGNTLIHSSNNQQDLGHGLFTQTIAQSLPEMPIISAEQLQKPGATQQFIKRVKLFAATNNY